ISRRNLREPVTLVRSPTFIKLLSGVTTKDSKPESVKYLILLLIIILFIRFKKDAEFIFNHVVCAFAGISRGLYFLAVSAIFRICSGVDPQQPPIILTRPSLRYSSTKVFICSAVCSYSPKAFGSPALGCADV